ncbi:nucleotidyltransferase domain-containing protein [Streptomyces sp. NPDC001787]|uniref:nucleotidyltransferase domain-containing protein n=1 Tax=Streptomyces sp. NPDC001787 TaxID=3154523 RepID=UPI00331DF005
MNDHVALRLALTHSTARGLLAAHPGARVHLTGALAHGLAHARSDIDLLLITPDTPPPVTAVHRQQIRVDITAIPLREEATPAPTSGVHTEAGTYRCPDLPGTLRLTRCDGRLHLWRRGTADPLTPTSPDTYTGPGYTLDLRHNGPHVTGFTLNLSRAPDLVYSPARGRPDLTQE